MRLTVAVLFACLAGCASAPMATHVDPTAGTDGATLVKEVCLGKGRGLVHFTGIDATKFKQFQAQKLFVSPGEHTIGIVYMAPGASWNVSGEGLTPVTYNFEARGNYIVRYRRTGAKDYKVWIEPIDASRTQAPNSVCLQPAFEDSKYWQ